MNENKISHLGFIQGIINRLGNNSFLIKGWCVTIVAALSALTSATNQRYLLIAYFPIVVFWLLDAYYLWQERLYREHYDDVRIKKESEVDFSMKLSKKSIEKQSYADSVISKTILPFYLIILGIVAIFMFIL